MLRELQQHLTTSHKHKNAASRKSGFTLVEVALSTFILVTVFVSALGASQIALKMMDTARMSTLASQVLQSQMENLRLLNWDELGDNTTADGDPSVASSLASIAGGSTINLLAPPTGVTLPSVAQITKNPDLAARFSLFTLAIRESTTSSNPSATPRPLVKQISLSIAWTDLSGEQHTRQYFSLYSIDGLNDYYYRALAP